MNISDLPALNAGLNGLAALLLIAGWILIKRKKPNAHRLAMTFAFGVSVIFLASYLTYHFKSGAVTRFSGPSSLRPYYLILIISHSILAAVVPPLCLVTLYRALKSDFPRHRRIARITFPIWLYVSITGVMVYGVLYHLYPSSKL